MFRFSRKETKDKWTRGKLCIYDSKGRCYDEEQVAAILDAIERIPHSKRAESQDVEARPDGGAVVEPAGRFSPKVRVKAALATLEDVARERVANNDSAADRLDSVAAFIREGFKHYLDPRPKTHPAPAPDNEAFRGLDSAGRPIYGNRPTVTTTTADNTAPAPYSGDAVENAEIERKWAAAGRTGTAKTRTVHDLMEEILFMAETAPAPDGALPIAAATPEVADLLGIPVGTLLWDTPKPNAANGVPITPIAGDVARLVEAAKEVADEHMGLAATTIYHGDDDEVGMRACCDVRSYDPHTPDCPALKLREALAPFIAAQQEATNEEFISEESKHGQE